MRRDLNPSPNRHMKMRLLHAALLLAGGACLAAAQGAPQVPNLPLAIVLVDELPFAEARAVVVRRKDMKPANVVLVTRSTSPADLSRAMAALSSSRRTKGDQVSSDMVAPIAASRSTRKSRDHSQALIDLQALRTARPRFIEGVGSRPVLFSHLTPPAAPRAR